MNSRSGAAYYDVEGVPVTLGNVEGAESLYCAAWDGTLPRAFPPDSVRRNGVQVSRERFLELRVESLIDQLRRTDGSL